MQRESRKEEQLAEPRKEGTERKRRFQIVKLEERIAPGGNGKGSVPFVCGYTAHLKHCQLG